MKISFLFKACILIILILCVLIFYSGRELILSKDMQEITLKKKENLEVAGRQLAKGSDYLTNEIRRYTQFGNKKHFHNFWKEVNETKSREVVEDLERLGALPPEIELIKKSKNYSDKLIDIEQQAMKAVKNEELEKARKLVFGSYYDQQKNLIMTNISNFQKAISKRMDEELREAENKTTFYLSLSISLVGISGLFVLIGFYILGLKKLVLPISEMSEIISESLKSDSVIKIPYENSKNEIGILSSSLNQLINKRESLENELKISNMNLEKALNKQTAQLNIETEVYKVLLSSIQFNASKEEKLRVELEILLKDLCSALHWDLGHIYFVSDLRDKLLSKTIWYSSSESEFNDFISVSNEFIYKKGEGLPGRVWESRKSLWIEDILKDSNFPRANKVENFSLNSGFAAPIVVKGKVFAIIEFFSKAQKNSDPKAINLLENIAIQIGKSFERLEQEKLLRKTNEEADTERARLITIMDNLFDGLIIIDSQGIIQNVNSAVINQFGYTSSELIGQNVKMIMPEPYHSEHDQYLKNYLTTGKAKIIGLGREVVGLRKDGSTFDLDLGVTQLDTHEGTSFIGTLRDITERKESEKELVSAREESEAEKSRLATVMDNLFDGLVIIDPQGIIQNINSAVTNQFGYTSSELIGQNVKMIMPEPYHSEHDQYLKNYLTTGKAKIIGLGREVVGLRKDGSTFDLDLGVTQLDTHEGTSFIGTLRDITERKESEKKLVSAREDAERANKAKSLFLANMSHEIRTPMNAVLGYSQILIRNKNLDRETLESIRTIETSGKNLLKMINEILDISKIEAGKMELNLSDFDLNLLIDNIDSMFELRCKQKQLKWSINSPTKPVFVQADEVKLRQILINLLGNAVKFTDSGEVALSITTLENNQYRFDVTDTGNGIPDEVKDTIFDAFQQEEEGAKKGGTGLGLAISKKQLELMGSELQLKSKINEGSNFHFTLNLPPADGENYTDRRGKHRNVLHIKPECKVKALVVDDIKENRDVLSKLLASIGAETLEAENGKEGLEKTIEHEPDIVFMDMRMPVMRGEEAVKLILEKFGKDRIKIVTITASALDKRREFFMDLGYHEFISKPFTAEQIYNCLEKLLGIEYVYDEDEDSQDNSPSNEKLDLSKLSIPQSLYEKMKESAEQYNITYLEKALEEAQQIDEVSNILCEHLAKLTKSYDMDAIINVLENISKTSS